MKRAQLPAEALVTADAMIDQLQRRQAHDADHSKHAVLRALDSGADRTNAQRWHDRHLWRAIMRICGGASLSMIAHPRVNHAMFTNVISVSL